MCGIYKITNLINQKSYIGQSVHIERRFSEHCFPYKTSCISKAIQKYGKNNFKFEVIEECSIDLLDEKEKYWINYYNTIVPNGYNVAEPVASNQTIYYHYDKECYEKIIEDLKNTDLSLKDIANKYNLNISTISRINKGLIHIQDDIDYPIRSTYKQNTNNDNYCIDCGKKIGIKSIRCNSCNNLFKRIPEEKMAVSREQLKNLIRTTSFTAIGKQFKVSDNTIKKWCKKYNLPFLKKEIKQYTDEQWKSI